ncbi:hypothetical protein [Panacagrimonas perspica]|uniref:hypothetical protein n=1 Tax=Panacagrimonas perspica TaxID=381431 RepID=UPI00105EC342|nr:hypothetical protein [Panacagrimonas perspica]
MITVIGALMACAIASSASTPSAAPAAEGFEYVGALLDPSLPELSGLAASFRRPGLHWALSDSGNDPALVAVDAQLVRQEVVAVEGVINHDWEDLASFEHDGEAWLLIADTGDNFSLRSEVSLILVPEPGPGQRQVAPGRVIRFRYEDGPRDCEAMAIDATRQRVLLADKGRHPVGLYELSIAGTDTDVRVARHLANFPDLVPTPPPRVQTLSGARWRGTATAMDLSPDGNMLIVLSTLSASLFRRGPDQDWTAALAQPVLSQRLPPLPMFESMALEIGGRSALLATEARPALFYRWSLPAP